MIVTLAKPHFEYADLETLVTLVQQIVCGFYFTTLNSLNCKHLVYLASNSLLHKEKTEIDEDVTTSWLIPPLAMTWQDRQCSLSHKHTYTPIHAEYN